MQASLVVGSDSWTVHKRVDEVSVFFTVTDRHRFVHDLMPGDIQVTDDRKPVTKISDFRRQSDLPLRLGLLVDTSGSVNPRFRFEQQASVQFLRKVLRRRLDQVFVLGFSGHVTLSQDFSDDLESLAAGVAALRNGGGTALFDAILSASGKLSAAPDGGPMARVLIVLSDGDDNASRITLNQALDTLQIHDITVYTINTKTASLYARDSGSTARGDAVLKRLAEQSGGRFFSEMDAAGVALAFSTIEEEMRNRYALFYEPADIRDDGRFRRIQIAAGRSGRGFQVHARKGYYSRQSSLNE
jgi:VWFA-related protein